MLNIKCSLSDPNKNSINNLNYSCLGLPVGIWKEKINSNYFKTRATDFDQIKTVQMVKSINHIHLLLL